MTNQSHTKRTPGPWTVGFNGTPDPRECYIMAGGWFEVACLSLSKLPGEHIANAAFIVRACNSHDALVAALRNLCDSISKSGRVPCKYLGAYQDARAALAAVTTDKE